LQPRAKKHEPGQQWAGSVREGEGWSVCGAPLAWERASIGVWGDALELIYAAPSDLDSWILPGSHVM